MRLRYVACFRQSKPHHCTADNIKSVRKGYPQIPAPVASAHHRELRWDTRSSVFYVIGPGDAFMLVCKEVRT